MKPSKSSLTDTHILLLLGLALFLVHMFTNHQYGFHQDEMVVLDNANNLDWGFVEYPPLTPFLARIELMLFGLSLASARTFAALAHSIVLVLTGLMARELGARRPAQILAAIVGAIVPIALIQGSLIQYVTFDFLWCVLIAYLMIRLLKSGDARWWLAIDSLFEQCAVAGTITNPYSIENDLCDPPDIFVCRNPLLPWPELWEQLKRYL